jgi:hypothetical protein
MRARTGLWAALLSLLSLALSLPGQAAVEARLSADDLAPGQPVTLTLTGMAPFSANIDLTPLAADFQVLEQRRAQSVRTINGQRSERHELILTLVPRRTGTLRVPALGVGDERSPALPLRVSAATNPDARLLAGPDGGVAEPRPEPAPPKVEVAASISPAAGVIGQEFVLRVTASSQDGAPVGRFVQPSIGDARVLLLGEQRTTDADGRTLIEQRLSIFPQREGRLSITDAGFDAWQPAGGAPLRQRAAPVSIEVSRPPAYGDGERWLPARALSLAEAGPSEVRVAPGQAVERMVTLRAEGLSADQLPSLPLDIPRAFRPQADPPRLWNETMADGVVGYRMERVLINTDAEGRTTLPAIAIDWWDTQSKRARTAKLARWTLTVAPFASEPRRAATHWNSAPATPPAGEPERPAAAPEMAAPGTTGASEPEPSGTTPWTPLAVGAAAVLGLLLAAIIGRRLRRRSGLGAAGVAADGQHATPTTAQEEDTDSRTAEQRLSQYLEAVRRAYDEQDAVAARDALLDWAQYHWPEGPPRNLSQLVLRLEPPLREDLKLLDGAFYGAAASSGDLAWAARPVAARLQALASSGGGEAEPASTT